MQALWTPGFIQYSREGQKVYNFRLNLKLELGYSKLLHKTSSSQIASSIIYLSPLLNSVSQNNPSGFYSLNKKTCHNVKWDWAIFLSCGPDFFQFWATDAGVRTTSHLLTFPHRFHRLMILRHYFQLRCSSLWPREARKFSCFNMNTLLFCHHWVKQS